MAKDTRQWLEDIGLGEYADEFEENRIGLTHLPDLTEDDLKELGVAAMGDRKSFMLAIKNPGDIEIAPLRNDSLTTAEHRSSDAERRQLTVMFCDLVGSTQSSQQLDPEDLREVIGAFQEACTSATARYDGYIARYMGDGILIYFGYPQAYEDNAERAVRAGIGIIEAVERLKTRADSALEVRVGIATGDVVVGDIIGEGASEEHAVLGDTPNLAARLQGVAEAGQILIGATTQQLIGNAFDLDDLGPKNFKGFNKPSPTWAVLGESFAENRFDAAHNQKLNRLLGREHELGMLLSRWGLAKGNEGQIMLLSGEAGIGKSRMILALRDELTESSYFHLGYQCTPHHTNSAFYPIIQRLERSAGFANEDTDEAKLDKLEFLLKPTADNLETVAPLIASLLSLPGEARYGSLELTPQQLRDQTITVLINQVLVLSQRRPVLFVVEDAHWIDPSTEYLIGEIMSRTDDAAGLMLITHRPNYEPPWTGHTHQASMKLSRLSRNLVAEIVRDIGGRELSGNMIERIIARTDGVPLYVEELAKSVAESGAAASDQNPEDHIPESLQASLIARLDRLSDAKNIAQIGAVIGRDFPYALIAAATEITSAELDYALDRIVASELMFCRGTPPEAIYTFKHALVRDAAYESLLKSTRREFHHAIAEALAERFQDLSETQPEILAYHYTEAGNIERAIDYWRLAGKRATEHLANLEAAAHCAKGLDLIEKVTETPERTRQELALYLTLGTSLLSTKGYAAPEVGRAYDRARELCEQVGDRLQLFPVLFGQWINTQQRGRPAAAKALAEETLALARERSDPAELLQGHHATWTTLLSLSDMPSCLHHAEQGVAIYDIDKHRAHAFLYGGHDPGVCGRNHIAISRWFLGYPDQALKEAHSAMNLAKELSHPFTQVLAFAFSSFLHHYRREPGPTRECAEAAMTLSNEQGLAPHYGNVGRILRGWSMATERPDEGLAEILRGVATMEDMGTMFRLSYFLGVMAEVNGWAGQPDEGLAVIAKALPLAEESGERKWEPELYRLKGELLLAGSTGKQDQAEDCFNQAVEVACGASLKSLELRAVTSLARLWSSQGKVREARETLAPLYGWFTEGFDTPDLKDAKELLDELG